MFSFLGGLIMDTAEIISKFTDVVSDKLDADTADVNIDASFVDDLGSD